MNFNYEQTYAPPAPMVQVRLFAPNSREAIELTALLDTGADITVIPAGVVERLRLPSTGDTEVVGFGGNLRTVPVFTLRLALGEKYSWLDQVVTWEEPYAILGRGVLNRWRIVLDGPRGVTTIE